MAQEGCNLNKDEAEVLKPSSPPPPNPSSSSQPTPAITTSSPSSSPPPPLLLRPTLEFSAQRTEKPEDSSQIPCNKHKAERCSQSVVKLGNRCSCCRKKVGLTGFRCRCGDLFCGRHRYSDTHDCSFDYKALGREEISKANPVIRAAKIIKI